MARKVMRSIRERRNELSSELLNVNPLLNEGFSRRVGVDSSSLGSGNNYAFTREDNKMIKDCAEERQKNPDYICGRAKKN